MKIDFSNLTNKAPEYDLMDLLEAGCHFGHQKAKRHPRMNEYIYAEKDGVHIFDLAKTVSQLQLAYNFVYDQAIKGKTMVMVGTKKQAKELVENAANESGAHYITARWLGGFLTNWSQVKNSLKQMINIENGLKSGKYDGYTKFEKVQLEKERIKLARFFEGLRDLKQVPDFLFVVDIHREKNAIKEAKNMGVPVVAIVDSNSDPEGVDIVIPANDDAVRSLSFLITEIGKAYQEGKKATGKSAEKQTRAKDEEKQPAKPEKKAEEKSVTINPEVESVPAKTEEKPKSAKPAKKAETEKVEVKSAKAKTEKKKKEVQTEKKEKK